MIRPLSAALAALLAAGCSGNPCTAPLERCGDLCFDLHSDAQNCGACGHACGAGLACVSGACVPDAAVCSTRTGGAFVTLGVCGEVVKVWISAAYASPFITRAQALAADPASPGLTIPQFDLRDGIDCDAQWTWHVDAATAAWVGAPAMGGVCSACPSAVEAAKPYWVFSVGSWCPDPAAQQPVRVLSVELR